YVLATASLEGFVAGRLLSGGFGLVGLLLACEMVVVLFVLTEPQVGWLRSPPPVAPQEGPSLLAWVVLLSVAFYLVGCYGRVSAPDRRPVDALPGPFRAGGAVAQQECVALPRCQPGPAHRRRRITTPPLPHPRPHPLLPQGPDQGPARLPEGPGGRGKGCA